MSEELLDLLDPLDPATPALREQQDARGATRAQRLARGALTVTMIGSAVVLLGWWAEIRVLLSVSPAFPPMKANAALCLGLLALAFRLHARAAMSGLRRGCAYGCVSIVLAVALVTLLEYALDVDLGIDHLLTRDRSEQRYAPGRMAPITALNLVSLAVTFCLLRKPPPRSLLTLALPALALLSAGFVLTGYLYGVSSYTALGHPLPIALNSGLALLLVAGSALLLQPERDSIYVLIGSSPEARPTRNLVAALLAVPLALGWLTIHWQRKGVYDIAMGVALLSTATMLILLALATHTGRSLLVARRRRERLEQELAYRRTRLEADARMHALSDALGEAIAVTNRSGEIVSWNRASTLLFGHQEGDALGKRVPALVAGGELEVEAVVGAFVALPSTQDARRFVEFQARRRDGSSFPCELSSGGFVAGAQRYGVLAFRDISERQRAQRELQMSERKYRALAVHVPVGLFEASTDGSCTFVNEKWTEITGWTFDEARREQSWLGVIHPDDRERVLSEWAQAFAANVPFASEYRYRTRQGRDTWVQGNATALRDEVGNVSAFLGTVVDITERRKTLQQIEQSEKNFRALIERAPFGVIVHREGTILYANRTYFEMLGYRGPEMLVGRSVFDVLVHPDARAHASARLSAASEGQSLPPTTMRCMRSDGSEIVLSGSSTSIVFDGAPALAGVAFDVTERERNEQVRLLAERSLRESLREKEILLKEIHHRVKNNLQVVVSLINLQASKIADAQTREVFDDMRHRVLAIALLHERLYRSKNLGRIDMRDYLLGIGSDLGSTHDQRKLELHVDTDELFFPMDTAVPIGLIVNELITNAYKHAFPGERARSGHVHVGLKRTKAAFELSVSDDGAGYPSTFDPESSGSLGLLLVSSLSSQLHGELTFEQLSPGTRTTLRFPDSELRGGPPLLSRASE